MSENVTRQQSHSELGTFTIAGLACKRMTKKK